MPTWKPWPSFSSADMTFPLISPMAELLSFFTGMANALFRSSPAASYTLFRSSSSVSTGSAFLFFSPIAWHISSCTSMAGLIDSRPNLIASIITSSATSSAPPSIITSSTVNPPSAFSLGTFLPTRKIFNSLFSKSTGLQTSFPSILPILTPAIGPLNGMSDMVRAAEAPSIAAISEPFSGSKDSTVPTT